MAEVENERGDMFGTERLEALLRAHRHDTYIHCKLIYPQAQCSSHPTHVALTIFDQIVRSPSILFAILTLTV